MSTFHVGDRVVLIESIWSNLPVGSVGTVKDMGFCLAIEFDDFHDGHGCDGCIAADAGWYVRPERVCLISTVNEEYEEYTLNDIANLFR